MTYTITVIGLLEMYVYIWAFIITLLITGLVYLINNTVTFSYHSKKNKDAGARRIVFFIGLIVNVLVVFFSSMAIANDIFRPNVAENNTVVVMNALEQAINSVTFISIPVYVLLFLTITYLLRNKYYKNMMVIKSNNKIFGLINTKG